LVPYLQNAGLAGTLDSNDSNPWQVQIFISGLSVQFGDLGSISLNIFQDKQFTKKLEHFINT